jgi:N-hydroxyarylamine O-acetyltransferase
MLLKVDLSGGAFVADVGFGGDGLVHPIALAEGSETWVGFMGHRLRREAEGWWVLEGNDGSGWSDLYAFTLEPHHPIDFVMANHFTSTWSRSSFVVNLTAQRSWPQRRVILRNRELVVREGAFGQTTTVRDPAHLLEVLETHFDLLFPAGTRFSQPEF